jgi:hypothetical protein
MITKPCDGCRRLRDEEMVSIEFRNLATATCRQAWNGDVRCTGEAEVMAVRYGRDGRCGRILKRERVSAGDRIGPRLKPGVPVIRLVA